MFPHPFGADRQGRVCAAVTDGEACGLTDEQHDQIRTATEHRARKLLVALRLSNRAEPPPPDAYEHAREQIEGALWEGLSAGRRWWRR